MNQSITMEHLSPETNAKRNHCISKKLQFDKICDNDDIIARHDEKERINKAFVYSRHPVISKTTLIPLAERMYIKFKESPTTVTEVDIPNYRHNRDYLIRFNFDEVHSTNTSATWQDHLEKIIDKRLLSYVKQRVTKFLELNPEIKEHFDEPAEGSYAGMYLADLADSIKLCSRKERFMVLVDDYDSPFRETFFSLMSQNIKMIQIKKYCPNYVSFFSACRGVVWKRGNGFMVTTSTVPKKLYHRSGFAPSDIIMFDALGLRNADVDALLDRVRKAIPRIKK